MRLNTKKPEEQFLDAAPLKAQPHRSPDQAHAGLRMSGGPPSRSIIDACLVITGNLHSERDVQVDGKLHGDIHCSQLVVSRDATIDGNIVADEVVVRGKVKGVIRAKQVMLLDTAQVESDIFHKSLVVEQGACFDGQSRRMDEAAKATADPKPEVLQPEALQPEDEPAAA